MGTGIETPKGTRRPGEDVDVVRGDLPSDLRIGLLIDGQPAWALRIGTLSANDCLLEFKPPGPCFPLGAKVEICVSQENKGLLTGPAAIEFRSDNEQSCTYRCRFADSRKLRSVLPEGIRVFFNRRRAHRVSPDPRKPVSIRIEDPESGEKDIGKLIDISGIGLAVGIEKEFELRSFGARLVTLAFRLPDHDVVTLSAHIRNRRMRSGKIVWGLEFDEETSEGFDAACAIVRSYVMKRQESLTNR